MPTKIEWVKNPDGTQGEVWNPVTGCTPITEGCRNCYAKEFHKRFSKEPFEKVVCHPERLNIPLKWKKRRRMVFVNSMSDLFHKDVEWNFIYKVFEKMFLCGQHTFVILTKRPDIMEDFIPKIYFHLERNYGLSSGFYLPNLWLMVSISTQKDADEFIPLLLETPAAKRGVSVEPMLERIDLTHDLDGLKSNLTYGNKLDWVICGNESGTNPRLCDLDHVRNLRDQCVDADVPFFLKQLMINGKLVHMPELDGQVWAQMPERNSK